MALSHGQESQEGRYWRSAQEAGALMYRDIDISFIWFIGFSMGLFCAVLIREAVGALHRWQERRRWYRVMEWLADRERSRK